MLPLNLAGICCTRFGALELQLSTSKLCFSRVSWSALSYPVPRCFYPAPNEGSVAPNKLGRGHLHSISSPFPSWCQSLCLSAAERLEALNRYGAKMENTRLKQMHFYYAGGVGSGYMDFTPRGTAIRPASSQTISLTSMCAPLMSAASQHLSGHQGGPINASTGRLQMLHAINTAFTAG